jgi:hypothetical protein
VKQTGPVSKSQLWVAMSRNLAVVLELTRGNAPSSTDGKSHPPGPSRGIGGRKTEPLRNERRGGNRLICYVVADPMYKKLTYLRVGPYTPEINGTTRSKN